MKQPVVEQANRMMICSGVDGYRMIIRNKNRSQLSGQKDKFFFILPCQTAGMHPETQCCRAFWGKTPTITKPKKCSGAFFQMESIAQDHVLVIQQVKPVRSTFGNNVFVYGFVPPKMRMQYD